MNKKIAIVTTLWSSINNWIKPFLKEYHSKGIDVTIICNMSEDYEKSLKEEFPFVNTKSINFPRGMSVLGSLKGISALYKFLKKEKFDSVQYSTPNASLYASVASKLAGVKVRLYCQWGMVYVARKGIKRIFFKTIEKAICHCSTVVQPDSPDNLEFCRKEGLYNEAKSCVIWNGSAKGIDLSRYDISKKEVYAKEIKDKYGITDEPVLGFVGRLGREKGCNELFEAFKLLKNDFPTLKLLFVGPIEKEQSIEPQLLKYFYECDDIIKTDRVPDVEKYMSAMDVFALPTYREGFGMSVVEASAMGIPVVVTRYPGPSAAMRENETGLCVDIKDTKSLYEAVKKLLDDKQLAEKMSANGIKFAKECFDQEIFKEKYIENRLNLLGIKNNSRN